MSLTETPRQARIREAAEAEQAERNRKAEMYRLSEQGTELHRKIHGAAAAMIQADSEKAAIAIWRTMQADKKAFADLRAKHGANVANVDPLSRPL